MRKDKYGRQYNRPVYIFGVLLILATVIVILVLRYSTG